MPRDNNPTHESSDEPTTSTRDNTPTTVRHGGKSTGYEEECPSCGAFGLVKRQVPQPGGPKEKKTCPECGHVVDDERSTADKR